jgi:hypothetical protein
MMARTSLMGLALFGVAASCTGMACPFDPLSVTGRGGTVDQLVALPDGSMLVRSERGALFRTADGGRRWNDWRARATLSAAAVADALAPIAKGRPPVVSFGAADLLPVEDGVLIAGIVNAAEQSGWGAVVLIDSEGHMRPIGNTVDGGLWRLERDAQGTVWAGGGHGAFVLRDNVWVRVWPSG